MLFNSYIFVFVFLPLMLALWWSRRLPLPTRLQCLVVASYVFYGWWDYRFVSLLLLSSVVDFCVGRFIDRSQTGADKKLGLSVSLATNLGLLAYFKYRGFAAESLNAVSDWLQVGGAIPVPEIILPLGISFYTFQTLSYTVDIYRGQAKPANSFWHFAAYVAMFPQLIAGPIVRYSELETQLREIQPSVNWDLLAKGIVFFVAGLAQKVLFADLIAERIDPMFADYHGLAFAGAWYAMLGYTCQLYFDFAGYSNMAVGLGFMLGFKLPQNFDSPYKAENISSFWRRWHITLSSFLRDYLYIPLGGNRKSRLLTMRNVFLVMLLGGLWHGAQWTFVCWGIYQGLLLVGHALLKDKLPIPRLVSIAVTFVAVVIGWVIFRSNDAAMCQSLLQSMAGLNGISFSPGAVLRSIGGPVPAGILAGLLGVVFFMPNLWQIKFRFGYPLAFAVAVTLLICILRFDAESPFLYFRF